MSFKPTRDTGSHRDFKWRQAISQLASAAPRLLYSSAEPTVSATGETTVFTFNLPANFFSQFNQFLEFYSFGVHTGVSDSTARWRIDGNEIASVAFTGGGGADDWQLKGRIFTDTAGNVYCLYESATLISTVSDMLFGIGIAGADITQALDLSLSIESSTAGHNTHKHSSLILWPGMIV